MNWFRSLDTIVQRVIMLGAVFCVLIVVLLTVGYCQTRDKAARANFDRNVAGSQADQGEQAATITAGQVDAEAANAAQTGRNREDILDAENANDTAGDAGDRGLRALCERVQYRDSVRCAELRRADRANAS